MSNWGKWVSKIQEPRKKSCIWLGTFPTSKMAARAHDVAALNNKGASAIVNVSELTSVLPCSATLSPHDIQVAAVKAVAMDLAAPQKVVMEALASPATLVELPIAVFLRFGDDLHACIARELPMSKGPLG
ncbi:hypothetical protein COCNU_scaffold003553G000020 [Cocos nucifera]|nr:hypothetical protein [Cocos nucifera]EHA8587908.1 hypothetical protein [Cocos nucifera]